VRCTVRASGSRQRRCSCEECSRPTERPVRADRQSRSPRGTRSHLPTLNLGILAHIDAGKTSLTERLLHSAGVIDTVGSVDAGSTRTDTLALERRRGITIRSAVLVVSAVEGVQAQTRVLMRTLRRLGIPRWCSSTRSTARAPGARASGCPRISRAASARRSCRSGGSGPRHSGRRVRPVRAGRRRLRRRARRTPRGAGRRPARRVRGGRDVTAVRAAAPGTGRADGAVAAPSGPVRLRDHRRGRRRAGASDAGDCGGARPRHGPRRPAHGARRTRRPGPADRVPQGPAAAERHAGPLPLALRRGAEGGRPGDAGRRVRHRRDVPRDDDDPPGAAGGQRCRRRGEVDGPEPVPRDGRSARGSGTRRFGRRVPAGGGTRLDALRLPARRGGDRARPGGARCARPGRRGAVRIPDRRIACVHVVSKLCS
jgi:hypothetical protein